MDSVVHAEDSSLANASRVSVTISERASHGVVTLMTQGGSSFLLRTAYLPSKFLLEGELPESLSLSKEELSFFVQAGESYSAERYVCDCLARTEYSCFQLRQKLIKKKFSKEIAKNVVDYVSLRGWADDTRFADLWIKSRVKYHPEGKILLKAKLVEKGISSEIIKNTIDSFFSTINEDTILDKAIQKYIRSNPKKSKEQLIASLQRKGFAPIKIKKKIL